MVTPEYFFSLWHSFCQEFKEEEGAAENQQNEVGTTLVALEFFSLIALVLSRFFKIGGRVSKKRYEHRFI